MLSTEQFSESVPRKFSQNFKSNFSNFLKLPPSKMEPKKKRKHDSKMGGIREAHKKCFENNF